MLVAEQGHGRGGRAGQESSGRIIAEAQPSSVIQGPLGYRRRKVHTLITLCAHCAQLAHFFDWSALECSKYASV